MAEDGWRALPLGQVATLQRGFDLPSRLRRRGSVPIVSSPGVSGWHDRPMVRAPGVVTGRYGTIGEVFFEDKDFWPLNTTLWVSDFHDNDEKFVYYLLTRVDFAAHSGKSGVPGVNRNDLHTEVVALPTSKDEQRGISRVLQDCDDLVMALERLIAKTQAIKHGMMQQLLTGRTRLPGFNRPWTEVHLGDHVKYIKTVALSRAQLDSQSSLRYLHYGDIHTSASVTLDAAHLEMPRANSALARNAGRLQVGDLVFADASEDQDGVGRSVEIVSVPKDGVIPGLHTIAARFNKSVLAHGFMAYLQFNPQFRSALLRLAAGTKVLATTRSHISSVQLSLPGVDEQRAIAQVLLDADGEILATQEKLDKARAIKQGMMQELLTGHTRLQVEEPAA